MRPRNRQPQGLPQLRFREWETLLPTHRKQRSYNTTGKFQGWNFSRLPQGALCFPGGSPTSASVVSCHEVPVDDLPDLFQVLGSGVAVVDVVGMLPDIDRQQGGLTFGDGGRGVGGVDDLHSAVRILNQPSPAGAEIGGGGLGELILELVQGAEFGIDSRGQGTGGPPPPLGLRQFQ